MKKLIVTNGTEFEQNLKDLALIETTDRAGKPTMISSDELNEGFTNADSDVKALVSFDVNGEEITVTPTTSQQIKTPGTGKNAITKVTINAVTSAIDSNIVAGNIKDGVTILGVEGSYEGGASLDLTTGIKFGGSSFSTLPTIIQNANWEDVTLMFGMFNACGLTTIPQLDTSNVIDMSEAFSNCSSLTTIPVLDTSSLQTMLGCFNRCTSLSNDSLNNILLMCANATNYLSYNKTLEAIGLSASQITTCQSLSNYDTFLSAGWTAN